MFYNVRILGPDGKLKKIIKSRELSVRHWRNFDKMEGDMALTTSGQLKVPSWIDKKLEVEFPDCQDATCYH